MNQSSQWQLLPVEPCCPLQHRLQPRPGSLVVQPHHHGHQKQEKAAYQSLIRPVVHKQPVGGLFQQRVHRHQCEERCSCHQNQGSPAKLWQDQPRHACEMDGPQRPEALNERHALTAVWRRDVLHEEGVRDMCSCSPTTCCEQQQRAWVSNGQDLISRSQPSMTRTRDTESNAGSEEKQRLHKARAQLEQVQMQVNAKRLLKDCGRG